jgi:trimeric autotransporter adhesin
MAMLEAGGTAMWVDGTNHTINFRPSGVSGSVIQFTTDGRLSGITAGTGANDAVNVSQLNSATKYFHANGTGADSTASGTSAIAIGQAAKSANTYTIAMGVFATASKGNDVAIGSSSSAMGGSSTAIGLSAMSGGDGAVALGKSATASATNSIAIGTSATASNGGAMAMGVNAKASNGNDVALGANSTTSAVVNTTDTTIRGTAYTFAGTNASSTVSVGGVGSERTITNVGAGRLSSSSTDAVNGSQLYATNQAVNSLVATHVCVDSFQTERYDLFMRDP